MATVTVSKYVEVDVDVDLGDLDDDTLIEELQSRGIDWYVADLNGQRQAMLRALWDGNEAKAVEILKTYLCDCLGRACI